MDTWKVNKQGTQKYTVVICVYVDVDWSDVEGLMTWEDEIVRWQLS